MLAKSLEYPFDIPLLQKKKRAIKKELLGTGKNFVSKKIAILGGSSTSEIKDMLELFLLKSGVEPIFYESEFNKYYEDVIFDSDDLKRFKPDLVYLHTSYVNIMEPPSLTDSAEDVEVKLIRLKEKFTSVWNKIQKDFNCIIIQNNFELPVYRSLGNLDFYHTAGMVNFVNKINIIFSQHAQQSTGFYINDINYLAARIGLEKWHDLGVWYSYKYALSYDAIPFLAHNLSNIIAAVYGLAKKCLVLDLDNTLWGGVIGDDGVQNIKIGNETALGEAHAGLQKYALDLKNRGVILAVCSKNEAENALEGFLHPDSVLTKDDFTSFKANWDPKHLNIKQIAKEINIGIDSLVFLDDNPAEREIVSSQLPEVSVPDVGNNIENFASYLDRAGYFEPISLLVDDLQRAKFYEGNNKREELESKFSDYGEFLSSLQMVAEINHFSQVYLDRIAQLTNKTNQFNLTTKRYALTEMVALSEDSNAITLYGRLTDKFGDNGLITVVAGTIRDRDLHIDLWLMSCRVLKRDMEFAIFDRLVSDSIGKGLDKIVGYFYKTAKNGMVSKHYESLGFELVSEDECGNSTWEFRIDRKYENKNQYIKVIV
jgi:FkbH-like protein